MKKWFALFFLSSKLLSSSLSEDEQLQLALQGSIETAQQEQEQRDLQVALKASIATQPGGGGRKPERKSKTEKKPRKQDQVDRLLRLLEIIKKESESAMKPQLFVGAQTTPVLQQTGATCGQHAIKNVELGVLYALTNNEKFKILMQDQNYLNRRFTRSDQNIACDRTYLKKQPLIQALQPSQIFFGKDLDRYAQKAQNAICVVETWEMFEAMIGNPEAIAMVQLSQPNAVFGFVVNVGGTSQEHRADSLKSDSHWVGYVIKKQRGVITDIWFFDSANGSPNERTLKKISDLAGQKAEQVQNKIKEKNLMNLYEDFAHRMVSSKDNFYQIADLKKKKARLQELAQRVKGEYNVFDTKGYAVQRRLSQEERNTLLKKIKIENLLGQHYAFFKDIAQ
jgi:hypothetical protein